MRHPLRAYREGSGKKDVDQFERTHVLRAAMWSLPGAMVGVLAAGAAIGLGGWSVPAAVLLAVAVWGATFATPLVVASLGGRAAGSLYNPSGRSTPRKREYSHAESLVARGLYQEAVDAFEIAIAEDPTDATPYLRIARLHRDQLSRPEDAASWFKRALTAPDMPAALSLLTARELVELYTVKLSQPGRAAPLLARLAEERAGTPDGEWAAKELVRVKALMAEGP